MPTDAMIEAGAKALQEISGKAGIIKPRWAFYSEAKAALVAAEQAAWRPIEEDLRGGERRLLLWEAFGNIGPHVELGWYRAGTGYVNTYGKPFHGDPTHFRPLPTTGEPDE